MGGGRKRNRRKQTTPETTPPSTPEPTAGGHSKPPPTKPAVDDPSRLQLLRLQAIEQDTKDRTTSRRKITGAVNEIRRQIGLGSSGSRSGIIGLLKEAELQLAAATAANDKVIDAIQDTDQFDKQYAIQLQYLTRVEEVKTEVSLYLDSRKDEAASVIVTSPEEDQRRRETLQKIIDSKKKASDAKEAERLLQEQLHLAHERVLAAQKESDEVERLSRDDVSSVAPDIDTAFNRAKVMEWCRSLPEDNCPDSWIDEYVAGRSPPLIAAGSGRLSSVTIKLDIYTGRAVDWYSWIDLFKSLVHDTAASPGEKLAILKTHLHGSCLSSVRGFGGGELAYKEALTQLKNDCGRKDVMRLAHASHLDALDYKRGDSTALLKFANQVRVHLFELSRVGERAHTDVIEKVCSKLQQQDRLAWNEKQNSSMEPYSLNEFGSWLCSRAAAYQNAHFLAADQTKSGSSSGVQERHSRNHHIGARTENVAAPQPDARPNKPFCFKCNAEHRLGDCKDFKALSLPDRLAFIGRHRLCYCCFGVKHGAKTCKAKGCGIAGCKRKHHFLLHDASAPPSTSIPSTPPVQNGVPFVAGRAVQISGHRHAAKRGRRRTALGAIQAEAYSSDGSLHRVSILYDNAADMSLIRAALARKLGLRGPKQILGISGAAGINTGRFPSEIVKLKIKTSGGDFWLNLSTLDKVTEPVDYFDWDKMKQQWEHLADLPLQASGGVIDILIGCDYEHLTASIETRIAGPGEPVAFRTALGWGVRGVIGRDKCFGSARVNVVSVTPAPYIPGDPDSILLALEEQFRRFCDTENFGTEFQQKGLSLENQKVIRIVRDGIIKLPVGRQASLPWKEGDPVLEKNRFMAESRLQHGLLKKFQSDPAYESEYRTIMQANFDQHYAELLPDDDPSPKYYLPHHGVYKITTKKDSTGRVYEKKKMRIVFDAAARYKGRCLNDTLYPGPKMQNELSTVLIRFREEQLAFAADVEGMFSRIRLTEQDANYQCFLWPEAATGKIRTGRMNRLIFGASCSPFVAIQTLHRIADDAGPGRDDAVSAIKENFYVDDYLDSSARLDVAVKRATQVREILAAGDFNLRGWISNSPQFIAAMDPDRPSLSVAGVPLGVPETEKLLGVHWWPFTDMFTFAVKDNTDVTLTRIGISSRTMAIYDPLGLAQPMTVKAKIKSQRDGVKYGLTDKMDEEDSNWWRHWFERAEGLNDLSIPRCLFPDPDNIIQSGLHTFCDASEEAYAAVIYIRNVYKDNSVIVRLVMAKTKVAPKKTLSIPRLELNAALMGSRLASYVLKSLSSLHRDKMTSHLWTDSSCTRNWVRATAAYYNQYVGHRLGEIQTLTEARQWRFVPGCLNPSDLATRSAFEEEDDPCIPSLWFDGPPFLLLPEDQWPKDLPWAAVTEDVKKGRVHITTTTIQMDWNQFKITPADLTHLGQLSFSFRNAIESCQGESFSDDIRRLKRDKLLHSTSSLLELTPILGEDGLLRVGGRVGRAQLPFDNLHPLILPSKHPLTEKLIRAYHNVNHHFGTDYLLAHLRQYFWILNGRSNVKRIRRSCDVCIRERAKPSHQLMGDLPSARLETRQPAFTCSAVDLFGPVEVSNSRNHTIKRYGVLITCLATRAVYIDIADSLSTDDFLLTLRRFMGMYGWPRTMFSDNGTNFVGADNELAKDIKTLQGSEQVLQFAQHHGFKWVFQPPASPHFGGAHESLVKSAKKALYRMLDVEKLKFRYPSDRVFQTLLFEISGLLNSRPLTYASSDPNDFRPITPKDFLAQPPVPNVPAGQFDDALPQERYRYVQRCINLFWDLWIKLYLPTLITRKKWKQPVPNIEVGDVVLIADKNLPRGQWLTGRVTLIHPGHDKLVRVADVQTTNGLYTRTTHNLCLLEQDSASRPGPARPTSGENVQASS